MSLEHIDYDYTPYPPLWPLKIYCLEAIREAWDMFTSKARPGISTVWRREQREQPELQRAGRQIISGMVQAEESNSRRPASSFMAFSL